MNEWAVFGGAAGSLKMYLSPHLLLVLLIYSCFTVPDETWRSLDIGAACATRLSLKSPTWRGIWRSCKGDLWLWCLQEELDHQIIAGQPSTATPVPQHRFVPARRGQAAVYRGSKVCGRGPQHRWWPYMAGSQDSRGDGQEVRGWAVERSAGHRVREVRRSDLQVASRKRCRLAGVVAVPVLPAGRAERAAEVAEGATAWVRQRVPSCHMAPWQEVEGKINSV